MTIINKELIREMKANLSKALDECIALVNSGESIDTCLAKYADIRQQIEPLLRTALFVSKAPKAAPSEEFRKTYKGRLMARLRQEEALQFEAKAQDTSLFSGLTAAWKEFCQAFVGARRVTVSVMIALLLISVVASGALDLMSPSPAIASQCTLSIFEGNIEVLDAGADEWRTGVDDMSLSAGMRIRTASESRALLTFFEGSTIELDSETDIEIKQVEYDGEHDTTIVMKQWLGKTWNRVVKMIDAGSRYEVQTPSAVAIVRGTQFVAEVDETGLTRVQTTEGLVSVVAQGEEVYVPVGQQTTVETGSSPSEPTVASPASGKDDAPGQSDDKNQGNAGGKDDAPGQSDDKNQGNAGGKDDAPGQSDDKNQGNAGGKDDAPGQSGDKNQGNAGGKDDAPG